MPVKQHKTICVLSPLLYGSECDPKQLSTLERKNLKVIICILWSKTETISVQQQPIVTKSMNFHHVKVMEIDQTFHKVREVQPDMRSETHLRTIGIGLLKGN